MRKVASGDFECLSLRTKGFPSQSEEGAICGYRKNHLQEGFQKRPKTGKEDHDMEILVGAAITCGRVVQTFRRSACKNGR